MSDKELIEKMIGSGLFDMSEEASFTWHGCDYCNSGLGMDVFEVKGFIDSEGAKAGDYYEFELCGECINALYYGEMGELVYSEELSQNVWEATI